MALWNLTYKKVSFTGFLCKTDQNLSVISPISPKLMECIFTPILNLIPHVPQCVALQASWIPPGLDSTVGYFGATFTAKFSCLIGCIPSPRVPSISYLRCLIYPSLHRLL